MTITEEYENLCFDVRRLTSKSQKGCDDIEHFSLHALIAYQEYMWNHLMTEQDRHIVEETRQANFEQTMFLISLDNMV